MSTYNQMILDFLSETEPLIKRVNELPNETAVELYDMHEAAGRLATSNIKSLDTELRVEICARQDEVLEHIIDLMQSDSVISDNSKPDGIYTPAVQGYRKWSNTELLKDKGLTGYMLAKALNARPVMYFGTNISDYPYLSVLPDQEVLFHDFTNGQADAYYKHLNDNYTKMDVLILHGMYEQTTDFLETYRKLRPDGKVYCGLDMNRHWMSRINWASPRVRKFADQCDIIATSSISLRDALNGNPNVNFTCHWLPNGFFNSTETTITADPDLKKNIILTVGRIGTAQKNNAELLIAFARVSNEIKDWTVRLVGTVDPEFQSFISEYFAQRPDLKSRVIFTGAITNKDELYREYAEAKIFALTSQLEGGTPNVYAEALFHGCMFVTSDIDAADDITGFGALGLQYRLGDIDALANTLVKLCSEANKQTIQNHIPVALDYATKYYDWHRNAKKLAYMLYKSKR
ncbi:glycosyltransferase family 4 protein [Paenibacillus sp. ACRRX]|uniref:glycosyltransferase family 4 protein n=1 Tax=Paenibacillus sp. ACRRX TaxID=2918206 RepID=UPI001EF47890|nr:glycosyltransferase family 4 protein [Paenibacillus sp. ACRRX]MCG7408603.1 glycosyltransferase family 4 protein [Paenibacillus sp. ACRRX]